jgi:outer membrane immunogenic protein
MKRLKIGLAVLATLIFLACIASAADNEPDATLKLTQRGVALGIGVSWGEGTVTFKGKDYPFKIHGLSINDIGVSKVKATGKVYYLKNIEDISGTYNSLGSEATMGKGVGAIMMKNQNGVAIQLITLSKGARAKLSVDGVELKLK